MATDIKLGLEEVLDQLYAAPPEDFVRLRNEQAKALAGSEAAQVKGLSRPTVVAWALNQLVRRFPKEVDALISAGQEVERAHRRLLSGVEGHQLQGAVKHRRQLLAEMEERTARILEDSGRSAEPHRAGIANTLQTASVEREAAELLRAGRFTKELPPPSGFGNLTGLALVPSVKTGKREQARAVSARVAKVEPTGPRKAKAEDDMRQREAERQKEKRERETAQRALTAANERAAEARRTATANDRRAEAAERRAETAEDEATRAEERAARARETAERLKDEAHALRLEADRALADAESAEREVKRLSEYR